jgi:hypothetical protein
VIAGFYPLMLAPAATEGLVTDSSPDRLRADLRALS